jgi:organic hydroperoxide reductase OsmC/OhrA
VELDGGVLVVRRIHVQLRIAAPEEKRSAIERVHGFYADSCPLYRSVKAAIAVTTEFAIAPP